MKRFWPVFVLALMVVFLAVPASAAEDGYNGYIDFLPVDSDWVVVPANSYTDVYFYGNTSASEYYCHILANTEGCLVSSKNGSATGLWMVDQYVCYRVRASTQDNKFYIRFTNNTDSEISFRILRCFGTVLSGSVAIDPAIFTYSVSGVDYAPSSFSSSSRITQFPSQFSIYTERSENGSYIRYFYLSCNSVYFSGMDSVTMRFRYDVTSTNGFYQDLGGVKAVEVFAGDSVIPCELVNISGTEIQNSDNICDTYFDVSFKPPVSGRILVRVMLSTAYNNLSDVDVQTLFTLRDVVGRYVNTYSMYDFYQQISDDLGLSFDELVSRISETNEELGRILSSLNLFSDLFASFKVQSSEFWSDMRLYMEKIIDADSTEGEDFVEKSEEQAEQIEQSNQVLDSVTKPAVDDMNISVNTYVNQNDIASFGSLLSVFFSGGMFPSVVMMSLSMALLSYVLFGKKG